MPASARWNPLTRPTRSGRPLWVALVAAAAVFLMAFVVYQRNRPEQAAPSDPASPAGLVLASQGAGTSLAAVGRTHGLPSACTAWLLAPGETGAARPSDPAYAVTAGRCLGITDSNTVLSEHALTGASVDFTAFAALTTAAPPSLQTARITSVEWASLRFTDLAVLRLDRTYGDLAAAGVKPIPVGTPATDDAEVLAAGVPVAGIPADQRFLRVAKCHLGDEVNVLEGPWLLTDAHATDCPGFRTGSAGSPAFDPAGQAVAMVVSSTIGLAERSAECPLGNPCAVTSKVEARSDTSYAVSVAGLAKCFTAGRFQLGAGCPLEDPATVVAAVPAHRAAQPGGQIRVRLGEATPASADSASAGTTKVASKVGPLTETDCHSRVGWGQPLARADFRLTVDLPATPGWVLACVGRPAQPTAVILRADGTAPDASRLELLSKPVQGGIRVWLGAFPDGVNQVWWASGPLGTDCAAAEGFTRYRDQPSVIPADDLPAVVCLVALDEAGNRSLAVSNDVG